MGCGASPEETGTGVGTGPTPGDTTGATDGSATPSGAASTGAEDDGVTPPGTTGTSAAATSDDDGPPIVFDVPSVDAPGGGPQVAPTDIEVVLTADNAYAFGYGAEDEMTSYFGGVEAQVACEIFCCSVGPEEYVVPADDATGAAYLYIIGYADTSVTQGVLGQFRRVSGEEGGGFGAVVYTGDPGWEACATGVDYNPGSGGPSLQVINEQIAACNAGNSDPATTSQGWVDEVGTSLGALAVGEPNDTPYNGGPQVGNEFALVCEDMVDPEALWMWFNWDPDNIVWPMQSPFLYPGGGANPMHDFMIFRLAADVIPSPPVG